MKPSALLATIPLLISCAHAPKPVAQGKIPVDQNYTTVEDFRAAFEEAKTAKAAKQAEADIAFKNEYVGTLTKPIKERICSTVDDFESSRHKYGYISAGDESSATLTPMYMGSDFTYAMAVDELARMAKNTLATMAESLTRAPIENRGSTGIVPIPELRLQFPREAFVDYRYAEAYDREALHKASYMIFGPTGPYAYCESMVVRDIPGLLPEWKPDEMFILTCGKQPGVWDSFASVKFNNPPQGLSLGGDGSKEWTSALGPDQRTVQMGTFYMMNGRDILRAGFSRSGFKGSISTGSSVDAVRVDMAGEWPCAETPRSSNIDFPLPEMDALFSNLGTVYQEARKPRPNGYSNFSIFGIPDISYDLSVPLKN